MANLTRKQLKEAFDDVLKRYERWQGQDGPNVAYMGQSVKELTMDVVEALDAFGAARESSKVDDDAKPVVLAIDTLDDELQAWLTALEHSPGSVHPGGSNEIHSAIEQVRESFKANTRKLPEKISSLIDSGVGMVQIAKIYGFMHADRTADIAKVREEIEDPGTHYDPNTWIHPADANLKKEIEERWAAREYVPVERITNTEPKQRQVAPEPLDQLIATNIPSRQIAKMKGITVEEVEHRAAQLGIALDGKFRHPVMSRNDEANQQRIAQDRQDAYPKSHPEIADMEERIIACAMDGWKPAEIAESLRQDYPLLTYQKAGSVIRAFELENESVEGGAGDENPVTA